MIHFTIGGGNGQRGDRIPGVWFHENGNATRRSLTACSDLNGEKSKCYLSESLEVKTWHHIMIRQFLSNQTYKYKVYINGRKIVDVDNAQSASYEEVKVYGSRPWVDAQDGLLANLMITSGIYFLNHLQRC